MKRRLFNILAALALLLLVATVCLWVRSYWYHDDLRHANDGPIFDSCHGKIALLWQTFSPPMPVDRPWTWTGEPAPPRAMHFGTPRWSFLGLETGAALGVIFQWGGLPPWTVNQYYLAIPYWMLGLLQSLLPAAWLFRRLRARPHQPGLCPHCQYDLRAHLPISELRTQNSELPPRCPECGTPIPAPKPPALPGVPTNGRVIPRPPPSR